MDREAHMKSSIKIKCQEIYNEIYEDWALELSIEVKTYYKGKYLSFIAYKFTENEQTGTSDISIKSYTLYKQNGAIYLCEIISTPTFINYLKQIMPEIYDIDCMAEFEQKAKYGFYIDKGNVYIDPIRSKVCTEPLKLDTRKIVKLSNSRL